MSQIQLTQRLISSQGNISTYRIRLGEFDDSHWSEFGEICAKIGKGEIYISDDPCMSVMDIRALARRAVSRYGVEILFIDYLQLITGNGTHKTRQDEVSFITRSLKLLARELNIPVVAISQLSRNIESRGNDAKPKLSDLRDSGTIEQDADVVIFIHRTRGADGQLLEDTDLILAKQRNGATQNMPMTFIPNRTRFMMGDQLQAQAI
jgi:replicative DNA helicase